MEKKGGVAGRLRRHHKDLNPVIPSLPVVVPSRESQVQGSAVPHSSQPCPPEGGDHGSWKVPEGFMEVSEPRGKRKELECGSGTRHLPPRTRWA